MALKYRLLMLMVFSASLASFAQYDLEAYWSDETGIYHFDPDQNKSDLIVPTFPSVSGEVHVGENKIYYLNNIKRRISVVDLDGGNLTEIFNLDDFDQFDNDDTDYKIMDAIYDIDNSMGYFTVLESATTKYSQSTTTYNSPSAVYSIDLETYEIDSLFGSTEVMVGVDLRYEQIPSLALDKTGNRLVYLIEADVDSRIESRALDGSDMTFIIDGFEEANQIEIDEATQKMFFITGRRRANTDFLYKSNLDGSSFETLFQTNIDGDEGFLMTASNIYFLDLNGDLIRSDLNGSNITNDVFDIDLLPAFVDDEKEEIYYASSAGLNRRDISNQGVILDVVKNFQDVRDLQIDDIDSRLLYRLGSGGAIFSMDFDGGNHERIYATASFDIKLRDWKIDVDDRRIITLEKDESPGVNTYDIYSRPLNDPSNASLVAADLGSTNVIDIDPIADNLVYFPTSVVNTEGVFDFKNDMAYMVVSVSGNDAIHVSESTFEQGEQLTFFNVNDPQNLVLSTSEDKLYWSNTSGSEGQYRINLDGSGEEKISDLPINSLVFVNPIEAPELVQGFDNVTFDEDAGKQVITSELSTYFSDPNGLELTFSASSDDDDITTTIEGDELSVTASNDYSGGAEITVSATNGVKGIATSFQVTVNPVNDAPVFELSTSSLTLDQDFEGIEVVEVTVGTVPSDEASQIVTYSLDPSSIDFATVTINSETGDISITAIVGQSGSQVFTVTADDGQSENNTHQASFSLTVNPQITLGTDDLDSSVRFYPNPVQKELHISVGEQSKADLKIIDASGQLILNQLSVDLNKSISVSELESGVYFLHIKTDGRKIIQRFIKAN